MQKPERSALTVWRIRALAALLAAALIAWLPLRGSALFLPFAILWAGATLLLLLWFLPRCHRGRGYVPQPDRLTIYAGVLIRREQQLLCQNVQYVTFASTPLERAFGIGTLIIKLPGGQAYLPGLTRGQGERVAKLLCGQSSHRGGAHE